MWRVCATGATVVRWAVKAPSQLSIGCWHLHSCSRKVAVRGRSPTHRSVLICVPRKLSSITREPDPPDQTSAIEAAKRGIGILREREHDLQQDDAMEALRCLLHAACAESVPSEVYLALGDLHYTWGNLLESGRKAELGAEGAAKAVISEIKELRRQSLKKRRLAPASGGGRGLEQRKGGQDTAAVAGAEAIPSGTAYPEAWEWYIKAANQGDSRAMMQLGDIALEAGKTSTINAQHAEEWFRRASRGDPPQPDALFQLARIRHEGIGVSSDPVFAREMYQKACDAGSSAAAFFLGHCFHVGNDDLGIEKQGARALQLLRRAAEQGHADAMFYLAQAYRSGAPELDIPKNLHKFGEMVQEAAQAGSADAMFALGGAYFHGEDGFARDPRAAFRCYSAAAELGHADASYCLGVMHYTMGNFQDAFACYQTATDRGNILAWRSLASMYALGEGVPRSEQMAKTILATFGDKIKQQERENRGKDGDGDEGPQGDAHPAI